MKAYVEPVCPFEGCEVGGVHYHRTDFGACKCRPGDPGHEADGSFTTRCYAPRPGNAKPETDPRHAHDPWILPTREQVARALFASAYGDDGEQWDEATGVRRDIYLDDADAVLALLTPWQQIEPGTTIKAGTRYRIEEEEVASRECFERTSVNDWTVANRSRRVYIDPRTVPAEPDPRVKAVAQVLAEKAGISLDEAEVEVDDDAKPDEDGDSQVASRTLTVGAELSITDLVAAQVEYTASRAKLVDGSSTSEYQGAASATGDQGAASATGPRGAASATGDQGAASAAGVLGAASATGPRGAATATGDRGAASATGYQGAASATGYLGAASATGEQGAATATGDRGAASATGDWGAATATGYLGAATATGYHSIAHADGYRSKAKGASGCALTLAERATDGAILAVVAVIVGREYDGETIEPDTYYWLHNGKIEVAE